MKKGKGPRNNVLGKLSKEVKKKSTNVYVNPGALGKHTTEIIGVVEAEGKNLKSNLESKNLDEYLGLAKLSQKKYEVLNEQLTMQNLSSNVNKEIGQNAFSNVFLNNVLKNSEIKLYETKPLAIPKRPVFIPGVSAKEFERQEREAFLNWRRALAEEEERNVKYVITPFEKNIEVWRQLWLVVEKCQILIQIVDGRNPLYFRCPDLESYITEVDKNKDYILLVNKADLMSDAVRKQWADYFKENGINYMFFSALAEGDKMENELEKLNRMNEEIEQKLIHEQEEEEEDDKEMPEPIENKFHLLNIGNDIDEGENNEEKIIIKKDIENVLIDEISQIEMKQNILEINTPDIIENTVIETIETEKIKIDTPHNSLIKQDESIKIYNREELIKILKKLSKTKPKNPITNCYYFGFIGFPNVGKSSVINVLMKKKRVAVAAMPGKTKHYQTLYLPGENEEETDKDFCLMDCPGLVFPSFSSSKADMLVNGILPIDTLREYHNAIAIIIQKIPRQILESFYKMVLPDIYSATQFLQVLALKRGYYTGRDLPDEAKTAKIVLKDYVGGKLLFCNLRPDFNEEIHGAVVPYNTDLMIDPSELNTVAEKEKQQLIREIPCDFDDNFEKIDMQVDGLNKNLKVMGEENKFDELYFEDIITQNVEIVDNMDKHITKEMKRALKFAMRRGDITEEEYDNVETYLDYENILLKIQKETAVNQKELVGVKIIAIK